MSARGARYRVLSSLGKGGMGEVFLADDTQLGRKVPIKFLTEALENDATARERLYREARAAAALDHPCICKSHEIAEVNGRPGVTSGGGGPRTSVLLTWGGSGRAMARTGLRMMPTSPSPPLKFRTVGFPQYGFKASLSDRACRHGTAVKPVPGIPDAAATFASVLRRRQPP